MKTILLISFLLFVSCSSSDESKDKKTHAEKVVENINGFQKNEVKNIDGKPRFVHIDSLHYKKVLKSWLDYYQLKLKNFEPISKQMLSDVFTKVDTFDLQNDIYLPFYKYSQDKQKILDVTSYNIILEKDKKGNLISWGSDIDSEVSVKDLKNKLIQRVIFTGSRVIIEDGFWINNKQLLIVGQLIGDDFNQFKPIIWFADLQSKTVQVYYYNEFIDKMKADYLEKIKYKNIEMAE